MRALRVLTAVAFGGALGCSRAAPASPPLALADESESRGILHRAARGEHDYFMPDSMGPGCALLDADGDGDLDAFFVQGIRAPDGGLESDAGRDRLLLQEKGGRFRDASRASGLDDPRYGMGPAVADVDGDGDQDVFVANFGSSRLYLNRGDATFEDATESCGIAEDGWAATAGFCDYDADGRPDLFVVRYLAFDPKLTGSDGAGLPDYPSPLAFQGLPHRLWHNEGGGRFRDVSVESGIAAAKGRGLGLAFLDLDGDGALDVFVANDSEPNFAWIQVAPGKFENRAFALGVAVNRVGRPEANMGVAVGDTEGDGALDLFVTHLASETNILYRRSAAAKYADATQASGLGAPSLDLTGFGTQFLDLEHDGDLDLLVVNGRIMRRGRRAVADLPAHWLPYAEDNHLYVNDGAGKFALAGPEQGGDWSRAVAVGRALAVDDVDGDGALDALVSNGDGSCRLFMNQSAPRGHWLLVRALDAEGRRDALDARIEVRAGGRTQVRTITTCQGYLAAGTPRAHFGLGGAASVDALVVHWPGGQAETFDGGAADREMKLLRGSGRR